MLHQSEHSRELPFLARLAAATSRRTFLKWSGVTIGVLAIGCDDDDDNGGLQPPDGRVALGSGDTGVLNYAFALEQLEAAFYIRVVEAPYAGITPEETQILTDIRDHEVIHRDFFRAALGSAAIANLEVTFETVDFTSRESVLTTARTLEDVGVSAYNGAGQLLTEADNLVIAGKIVSVEARHAAAIRDLLAPKSAEDGFAGDDVVNEQGLDVVRSPSEVLTEADPLIVTEIDASGLPVV